MPHPDRPLNTSDVTQLSAGLDLLTKVLDRRIPDLRTPGYLSPFEQDVGATASEFRADGATPWGDEPAKEVLLIAGMYLATLARRLKAVRAVLVECPEPAEDIDVLTRAALETAAKVWWLLEPKLTGRARVARLYVIQRRSIGWLESLLDNMDQTLPAGPDAMTKELEDYFERNLGLRPDPYTRRGGWTGSEGQSATISYSSFVSAFLQDIGHVHAAAPYSIYSGSAHGEAWRLGFGYRNEIDAAGHEVLVPLTAAATVGLAVGGCLEVVWHATVRVALYMGRGAAVSQLRELVPYLRSAVMMH